MYSTKHNTIRTEKQIYGVGRVVNGRNLFKMAFAMQIRMEVWNGIFVGQTKHAKDGDTKLANILTNNMSVFIPLGEGFTQE